MTGRRSTLIMLVSVALIAAVVFALCIAVAGPMLVVSDGISYNAAAMRLLNTGIYSYLSSDINSIEKPNAFITPGYILLLAFIYLFLPHAHGAYASLQGAMPYILVMHFMSAVGTVVLISATAHTIAGRRVGWIAGVLGALYLPFGVEVRSGMSESVALFFTTACLYLAVRLLHSRDQNAMKWLVAFGLCGGITVMIRPVTLLWLLVPIAFWSWSHRTDMKRAVVGALIGCAAIALVMTPWVIRNAIVLDRFIPLTTHGGAVWIESVGGIRLTPAEQALFVQAARQGKDAYGAVATARFRRIWATQPGEFVLDKALAALRMVAEPYTSIEDPNNPLPAGIPKATGPGYRLMSPTSYALWTWITRAIHWIVLALAAAGLLLLRRKPVTWLLASMPAYYLAVNAIIFAIPRYFYPAMPAVIVLASLCVGYVLARQAQRGAATSPSAA